ncbi:MAG TPA: hypothetical protein VN598_02940 [Usitatibacter sp.]|nr:hypothetical protein [Usitatibacter sp.]
MIHRPDIWFAFLVIPVYFGLSFALSRTDFLAEWSRGLAFCANWILAAAVLGGYTAFSGLAGGDWFGVGIFSGALAALLATAVFKSRRDVPGTQPVPSRAQP